MKIKSQNDGKRIAEYDLQFFGGRGADVKAKSKYDFVDNSKYKKQHDEVIDFIKKQIGIDLNKYRDGNGESPFTTTYWDKTGDKVAFNYKQMPKTELQALYNLQNNYGGKLLLEESGTWIGLASFKRKAATPQDRTRENKRGNKNR